MKASENLATMKAANLPHLDWRTMLKEGAEKLSAEDTTALDKYFAQFIQLDFDENAQRECPSCHGKFGKGGIEGFLMAAAEGYATLNWGITNGEATCSRCQYPFRCYHRDVGPIHFLNFGLPYHPDELQVAKAA